MQKVKEHHVLRVVGNVNWFYDHSGKVSALLRHLRRSKQVDSCLLNQHSDGCAA